MDATQLYARQAQASIYHVPTSASSRTRDLIKLIREGLVGRPGAIRAMELGFGDGELLLELARNLQLSSLIGVDISQERIDACDLRATELPPEQRPSFRRLDLENGLSQLEPQSAELVVAIDVLEHVFDVFGFVANIARVLTKGGRLVLRVPNAAYLRRRLELLTGRLPVTASWFGPPGDLRAWRETWGWDGGHLHYFTLSTLKSLLQDAGLHVRTATDAGVRYRGLRQLAPQLLLGNLCVVAERRV